MFGEKLIERTSFDVNVQLPVEIEKNIGVTRLDGIVRGHIDGEVVGYVRGTVIGEVNLRVSTINKSKDAEDADIGELLLEDNKPIDAEVKPEEGGASDEE